MLKKFKHNFVKNVDLSTENIDGKRHYVLPDGTKLKSVTTILGEKTDQSALEAWKLRVGPEEAQRVADKATKRGTLIHSLCEAHVLNQPLPKVMPIDLISFKPIREILNKRLDNIYGVELALWSKVLGCAGRTDVVGQFDGITSIVDFKTSLRPKKEEHILKYFLQETVYSLMFEYMYKISVPQIVTIITVDNEMPQVYVKNRKDYINEVLRIFKE